MTSMSMEVSEALSLLTLSTELKEYITSKRDEWAVFGKMNSHLYRAQLMKMMVEKNMSAEARFMVFFFFSVIKNQPRVLRAMDALPVAEKEKSWFSEARDFIATKVTQYVSQASKNKKFPAVNIPSCNPGLDILVFCLITPKSQRTIANLKNRTTFCQIHLNDEMQKEAREGYMFYWDNVVKGTKNPDKESSQLEDPKMREEYYMNPASDRYKLVNSSLKEVSMKRDDSGYDRQEILNYMESI